MSPPTHTSAAVLLLVGILFAGLSVPCIIGALIMLRRRADRDMFGFGMAMLGFFCLGTLGLTAIFRAYTWSSIFPMTSSATHEMNLVLFSTAIIAAVGTAISFLPAYCEYRSRLTFERLGYPYLL